ATTPSNVWVDWNADQQRRSLWSADAWSRFGSRFRDPDLALKLAKCPPRTHCGLRYPSVVRKVADQRIDYQRGSKHPHSKNCRISVVVAVISQRSSTHGNVCARFLVASATAELNRR